MINNEFIQAPFKSIQNSNINLNQLKLLKSFIHFKTVLSMLKKDPSKSFLELLDDKTNDKLQRFYNENSYDGGFISLIDTFNTNIKNLIDPTIYLNYIDENGNKHFFYDE
ncbi:UNVERIFIED_CONTAM: hypothetical protein O8I53_13690 [Campylobacter lari]